MLNLHLDELIRPGSSVAIAVNPSRKLSWTKTPKTVAAIITVNVRGHKDGGISFTEMTNLGSSIVEGVKNYVVSMRDTILAQFIQPGAVNITEIK